MLASTLLCLFLAAAPTWAATPARQQKRHKCRARSSSVAGPGHTAVKSGFTKSHGQHHTGAHLHTSIGASAPSPVTSSPVVGPSPAPSSVPASSTSVSKIATASTDDAPVSSRPGFSSAALASSAPSQSAATSVALIASSSEPAAVSSASASSTAPAASGSAPAVSSSSPSAPVSTGPAAASSSAPTSSAALPSSSASAGPASSSAAAPPAASSTSTPVGTAPYVYLGCFADNASARLLATGYTDQAGGSAGMTIERCLAACATGKHRYCALQYGQECWTADALTYPDAIAAGDQYCQKPCAGDATEHCGAGGYDQVYVDPTWTPPLDTPPTVDGASFVGCYTDLVDGQRSLTGAYYEAHSMTIPVCIDFCRGRGFVYAALEHGSECRCDSELGKNGSTLAQPADSPFLAGCNVACTGDDTQTTACGGSAYQGVYSLA